MQIWLNGKSCSGKTQRLVAAIQEHHGDRSSIYPLQKQKSMVVLAANNQNQRELADLLQQALKGQSRFMSKTPLGFMADEVELFLPLIYASLGIEPKYPLRLRPELEQKYATDLWTPQFQAWDLNLVINGRSLSRLVRRLLDLLQLAGAAMVPPEEIGDRLQAGQLSLLSGSVLYGQDDALAVITEEATALLTEWRNWCLERGFLTYGIIYELYWRYLLPNETYQLKLLERFDSIWADDVHDYPAIAKRLCDIFLDHDCAAMFTANPDGQTRLGLNADPDYLRTLASRCDIVNLDKKVGLAASLGETLQQQLIKPGLTGILPTTIQSLQTLSRANLLQQVITEIRCLIQNEQVSPKDIAIIAPGLDEVARYTFMQSLTQLKIPIEPLSEQRPLYSSPWGRSPITLLALIYPHCGRLLQTSEVAEMLLMFSQTTVGQSQIDPIRAGLLVDYCYQPDPDKPQLLPAHTMSRGDRLGYQATTAYEEIRQWIMEKQRSLDPSPLGILTTLHEALNNFFLSRLSLNYEQAATLRELTETCQHYFEGDRRRSTTEEYVLPELIKLLQADLISTNPRPTFSLKRDRPIAITLATIFQYRSARPNHRYQFWLDAGSRLWEKGGAAMLFGYGIFQQHWDGEPWSLAAETAESQQRLQRIVQDLLGRCTKKIYLCHSDLSVNGNEQMGPLFPLIQASQTLETPSPQ